MKTPLGKLPLDQSESFLFHNATARAGSLTTDGQRRLYTHETGAELTRLRERMAELTGVPVPVSMSQVSIPLIAPGVRDLTPCVPCQATHDKDWANLPATIDEFRNILTKMVDERNYEFPSVPDMVGDGIVVVGGGKFWAGIVVSIRMLRESGCTLPVEVWYRGDLEPINESDVSDCGDVRFVDTYAHAARHGGARILGGWESKIWAIANTTFRRILFLDADAYCLTDPTAMIESLTGAEPFQFWRDRPTQEKRLNWKTVWPKSSESVPPVQGGHLLIDRLRCWKLICLTHWMNQHSDFYYQHMYGDQDTWRVALEAIGYASLWKCRTQVEYVGGCFVVTSEGQPVIVHRVNSKLFTEQWREGNSKTWDGTVNAEVPGDERMAAHWGKVSAVKL